MGELMKVVEQRDYLHCSEADRLFAEGKTKFEQAKITVRCVYVTVWTVFV
jgi:hypothetical protein